ncbi:MAG: hypothetical protein AAF764_00860 [Pseudomonadota bacterium]
MMLNSYFERTDYTEFQSIALSICNELYRNRALHRGEPVGDYIWKNSKTGLWLNNQGPAIRQEFLFWFVYFTESNFHEYETKCETARNTSDPTIEVDLTFWHLHPFVFKNLLRTDLRLDGDQLCNLVELILSQECYPTDWSRWHFKKIARLLSSETLTEPQRDRIASFVSAFQTAKAETPYHAAGYDRVIVAFSNLLHGGAAANRAKLICKSMNGDEFGTRIERWLKEADRSQLDWRIRLLTAAANATNGKPTATFLKQAHAILKERRESTDVLRELLNIALDSANIGETLIQGDQNFGYFTNHNNRVIKGLIWMCSDLIDNEFTNQLFRIQRKAYANIQGHGCGAEMIGNAVSWVWKQQPALSSENSQLAT